MSCRSYTLIKPCTEKPARCVFICERVWLDGMGNRMEFCRSVRKQLTSKRKEGGGVWALWQMLSNVITTCHRMEMLRSFLLCNTQNLVHLRGTWKDNRDLGKSQQRHDCSKRMNLILFWTVDNFVENPDCGAVDRWPQGRRSRLPRPGSCWISWTTWPRPKQSNPENILDFKLEIYIRLLKTTFGGQ